MPKTVEIKLHRLTCEFADNLPEGLDIAGSFVVLAYDNESDIKQREVLYDSTDRPTRLRKGESVDVNRETRINLNAPSQDSPHKLAPDFVKFGAELTHIGGNWQPQKYDQILDPEPRIWRLYFGRNDRIVRADFSTRFVNFS